MQENIPFFRLQNTPDASKLIIGKKEETFTLKSEAILHTIGCRLNTADTALLTGRLETANYRIVAESAAPALIVINSCAVTAEAVRKSRQAVRKFRHAYPEAVIIVTGCAAELDPETFRRETSADLVLTNPEKREIVPQLIEYLNTRHPGGGIRRSGDEPVTSFHEEAFGRFPFRSRAFIKVQEGCNNFCTYCIVPHVRGRERSRAFDEVLEECRQAVAAGFPELVLTGVNICAYSDGGRDLGGLISAIARLEGDFRIRLSSTEPDPHNLALLDVMASEPRVCRFLHLALQHGSDRILQRMNRHYTTAEYAQFAAEARKKIPDLHLGSDLIVGFPGETEEDFAESCAFVESMRFANLHIFSYSPRAGTPAAEFPDPVPPEIMKERYGRMREVAATGKRFFRDSQLGRTLPVIFETVDSHGFLRGWSDNYLAVHLPSGEAPTGRIVPVVATEENLAAVTVPEGDE